MALENLVNIQGRLKETFPQLDPSTIQISAQIMKDRHTDEDLRNKWFWTADSALYTVEDGQEVLYLGGIETNLVFRNLNEAVDQLLNTQNYHPNKQDIQSVVEASTQGKVSRIRLSDLDLKKENDEFCYYEIDTENYNNSVKKGGLNKEQRAVAEQVYGKGADFDQSMKDLSDAKISKTRVWVLNPKYVKTNVGENNGIARACWLNGFGIGSRFYADCRSVDDSDDALRGYHTNHQKK